jgi:Organic radical activating enzymes
MHKNYIPISEIFYSIQGEGINLGKPAVFIRVYFCNLYCEWCDTKYTWLNQEYAKEGIDYVNMNEDEIIEKIGKYPAQHVVITGGEPLLSQSKLINLIRMLKEMSYYIEIETNGTIKPNIDLIKYVDNFSVSPKLSNSKVDYKLRIRYDILKYFSQLENVTFKFVICDKEDLKEMEDIINKIQIEKRKVIIMPEGTDEETIKKRSCWLIEYCKERSYRYSPRIHIWLYGNKRGF